MDNLSDFERERGKLIRKVQGMLKKGYSGYEIAEKTGINLRSVYRYRYYDPSGKLDRGRRSELSATDAQARVLQLIKEGYHIKGMYDILRKEGMHISRNKLGSIARELAAEEGIEICRNHKGPDAEERKRTDTGKCTYTINRHDIMEYLWSGTPLGLKDMGLLYEKYPVIFQLKKCIEEFRYVFSQKSMPSLYLFIDKYKVSSIRPLRVFALNLEKDFLAVENSVASDYSNGLTEGANNRIKTIKRVMYGRCSTRLLKAKVMYNIT